MDVYQFVESKKCSTHNTQAITLDPMYQEWAETIRTIKQLSQFYNIGLDGCVRANVMYFSNVVTQADIYNYTQFNYTQYDYIQYYYIQ